MGLGIYIHIPFCLRRCVYCAFNSYVRDKNTHRKYMSALSDEMELRASDGGPLSTLYVGGGTPTVIEPELLAGALNTARRLFRLAPGSETTVEANPGTLEGYDIAPLVEAGVNRVSIGAQSFSDEELATLGRLHTPSDTADSVRRFRSAGITNIGMDLIYGIPGQDIRSWSCSVEKALELEPQHMSLYCLSAEEGTPLQADVVSGRLVMPQDALQDEMYCTAVEMLRKAGLNRYEISNFARPGFECRHNLNYWDSGDFVGLGAGASSQNGRMRTLNETGIEDYMAAVFKGSPPFSNVERISFDEARKEYIMLALRTGTGLSFVDYQERFGRSFMDDYEAENRLLTDAGCIVADGSGIRLTGRGIFASNAVISEFF